MPSTARRCLAVLLLGLGAAAPDAANTTVYYRAGAWEAFAGRAESGGTFCGISTYFPRDGRGFMIRFRTGDDHMIFRARKPDWQMPEGTSVAISLRVGPNAPFEGNATGQSEVLEWTMSRETMAAFDAQFRRGTVLTVAFPSGNEAAWAIPLAGSNAIGATFTRCIGELAAHAAPTQPFQSGTPQAPAAGPTQPFTPTPAQQQIAAPPTAGTAQPQPPASEPPRPDASPAPPR